MAHAAARRGSQNKNNLAAPEGFFCFGLLDRLWDGRLVVEIEISLPNAPWAAGRGRASPTAPGMGIGPNPIQVGRTPSNWGEPRLGILKWGEPRLGIVSGSRLAKEQK